MLMSSVLSQHVWGGLAECPLGRNWNGWCGRGRMQGEAYLTNCLHIYSWTGEHRRKASGWLLSCTSPYHHCGAVHILTWNTGTLRGSHAFFSLHVVDFSSWASNRYWGKNTKYLSSEVPLMGHLLIFDWKLKFFNENKIVVWSRIVLFIKYNDSRAGPCSQESLAPISWKIYHCLWISE